MANEFGIPYIETSAKLKINVDQAFHDLVRSIRLVGLYFARLEKFDLCMDFVWNCFPTAKMKNKISFPVNVFRNRYRQSLQKLTNRNFRSGKTICVELFSYCEK